MKKRCLITVIGLLGAILGAQPVLAHGPLFSPAPETIWKDGTEVTLGYHTERASGAGEKEKQTELYLEAEYGITADWQIGIEIPYVRKDAGGSEADGLGDMVLDTKYQFWKRDLPGEQYKAAAFFKIKLPTGNDDSRPRLGTGSTDFIAGLAAGYESRRWYWFTSATYRANSEGDGGLEKGDRQSLNAVGGIRPVLTAYDEPDTVLMVELNWERAGRDTLRGDRLDDTGGWALFLSPVFWVTYRQYALRGGIQIPIAQNLNGEQPDTDYRVRIELVYHF